MPADNGDGNSTEKQLQKACAELVARLRAGTPCHAETFLGAIPELSSHEDLALELVYTEFVVREELGQNPSPLEWFTRFPQWRHRLERIFQADLLFHESGQVQPSTAPLWDRKCGETKIEIKHQDRWLDHYEVLERIGRGGMGIVYKARQFPLNRIVALKMIRMGDDATPEAVARFKGEAEKLASLHHPNIVQIYAVGEWEGLPCFSMEYIDGGNLSQKIGGRPQPARQSAQWMEAVARAVHYSHEQGLVHRDLKPGNIVLTVDGVPKITDFGLAKRVDGDTNLTLSGVVVGTVRYCAPESAAGRVKDIGPLSDVYSLGAILYELLTGQAPFKAETHHETLQLVQTHDPVRPRVHNPAVDRELEAVCLKCLEKRPRRRYASAQAVADDLARWLRGEPTGARPRGWLTRLGSRIRRRPLVSAAIVLALLGALIAPVVAYFREPARKLDASFKALRQGKPVTLIGRDGGPAWFQVIPPLGDTKTETAPDGTFSVTALRFALVELLPDPQLERYRFSAEVRHDTGAGPSGKVGIYFAGSKRSTAEGQIVDDFWGIDFNDIVDMSRPRQLGDLEGRTGNPVLCFIERHLRSEQDVVKHKIPKLERRFPRSLLAWRKVAVLVTPERIKAFWDHEFIGELSLIELMKSSERLDEAAPVQAGLKPIFAPRGALGLYVFNAAASFRSVKVEPLEQDN
jgi:serine/threonine-protein kinase